MNDKNGKSKDHNNSKERWPRNELREALQTHYKTVPTDD
jgi:hypothetical protein